MSEDAAWRDSDNGLEVYAGTDEVTLSPYDALVFSRAIAAAADLAETRRVA